MVLASVTSRLDAQRGALFNIHYYVKFKIICNRALGTDGVKKMCKSYREKANQVAEATMKNVREAMKMLY